MKKIPLHSLVVLLGPAASGKTTLSKRFKDYEVVSSDTLRHMLCGDNNRTDLYSGITTIMFQMISTKLSLGERVVVETHTFSKSDRMAIANIGLTRGVPVFYLIVDRPLLEKQRDAGWRSTYPKMIERSHDNFLSELPDMMIGDGIAEVIDTRISDFSVVEKFDRTDLKGDAIRRGFRGLSVIGDVHGHQTAALEAIDWARQRNHLIVFLGDLIDYGPKNIEMIDTAYSYITRGLAINVLGNHEVKISKWFDQKNNHSLHLSDGNKTTIRQIETLSSKDQLKVQTKFSAITGLGAYHWVADNIIMSHGGASEKMKNISDSSLKGKFGKFAMFGEFVIEDDNLKHTYKWVDQLGKNTIALVGHNIRNNQKPLVQTNKHGGTAVFMDTGSGKGGYLSVADIPFSEMKVTNFFRC